MANNKLVQKMPSWAVGVLAVAGTAAALFIGWKIYKKIHKSIEDKKSKEVAKGASNEVNQLLKQGQKLSYADSNYKATANTIQKLLDGCEVSGTELQVINEIIKVVKNPVDWWYLVKVFGNRDVSDCGAFGWSKTNYDLISLLKDQLDTFSGYYKIDTNGYKDSGVSMNTLDILTKFLSTKGISI